MLSGIEEEYYGHSPTLETTIAFEVGDHCLGLLNQSRFVLMLLLIANNRIFIASILCPQNFHQEVSTNFGHKYLFIYPMSRRWT